MQHFKLGLCLLVAWLLPCTWLARTAMADVDSLVILTSHHPDLVELSIAEFKNYFRLNQKRSIQVDWLDQGGSSKNLQYLQTSKGRKSAIDIVWGGGEAFYQELSRANLLSKISLDPALQKTLSKYPSTLNSIYPKHKLWAATSLASFGVLITTGSLEEPPTSKEFFTNIIPRGLRSYRVAFVDPRHSRTASAFIQVLFNEYGYDSALLNILYLIQNHSTLASRNEDALAAVSNGSADLTFGIDYLILKQLNEIENDRALYIPVSTNQLMPDPIAILATSKNKQAAQEFVNFVMSDRMQQTYQLAASHSVNNVLYPAIGRISINPKVFDNTGFTFLNPVNPFEKQPKERKASKQFDTEALTIFVGQLFCDLASQWKNQRTSLDSVLKKLPSKSSYRTFEEEFKSNPQKAQETLGQWKHALKG